MRKQLSQEWYNLLKEIDFSEIKNDVSFDDENCIFEANNSLVDVLFDEYILAYGMEKGQNRCTEYGRRLYMLYDLLFFSDVFDIKDS